MVIAALDGPHLTAVLREIEGRVQRERPSAEIAAFTKTKTNRAATPTEPSRIGRLFGKFWNQIVKIVTARPC